MEIREIVNRISQLSGFSTLIVFSENDARVLERIDGTGHGSYSGNSDFENYLVLLIKSFQKNFVSELYFETKEPCSVYLIKKEPFVFALIVGSSDGFGYCKFLFDQVLNIEDDDQSEKSDAAEEEIPNIFKTMNKNEIFKFLKK